MNNIENKKQLVVKNYISNVTKYSKYFNKLLIILRNSFHKTIGPISN